MGINISSVLDTSGTLGSYKSNIITKLKNGENETSVQIGGKAYTKSEWEKVLDNFDTAETALQKESEKQIEERKAAVEASQTATERLQEAFEMCKSSIGVTSTSTDSSTEATTSTRKTLTEMLEEKPGNCPYASKAVDGIIAYNGVQFNCDYQNNAITLGDVSNKNNNMYVGLSKGGTLIVNKENVEDLKNAITMFSPADQKLILQAIASENLTESKQIEEDNAENEIVENIG